MSKDSFRRIYSYVCHDSFISVLKCVYSLPLLARTRQFRVRTYVRTYIHKSKYTYIHGYKHTSISSPLLVLTRHTHTRMPKIHQFLHHSRATRIPKCQSTSISEPLTRHTHTQMPNTRQFLTHSCATHTYECHTTCVNITYSYVCVAHEWVRN